MKAALQTWVLTPVFVAFVATLLFNLVLIILQPLGHVPPERLPADHTYIWWATQDLMRQDKPPQVVLLGSSLVMNPIAAADADCTNSVRDFVTHHRAPSVESGFEQVLGLPNVRCFNFGLPGAMVSDDYLIARTLLAGKRQPQLIVLCLGLRDFIDSGVGTPASTGTFKYLSRFADVSELASLYMPNFRQQADYQLGNLLYLQGKRFECQYWLGETIATRIRPINAKLFAPSLLDETAGARGLEPRKFFNIEENDWVNVRRPHFPAYFMDNSQEYRDRYKAPNKKLFAVECHITELLTQYCRERGIDLLVVNMPITKMNKVLMPAGYYDQYLTCLRNTCRQHGFRFVDANSSSSFAMADFNDTCHLNAQGGRKLIDLIMNEERRNRRLLSALGGGVTSGLIEGDSTIGPIFE